MIRENELYINISSLLMSCKKRGLFSIEGYFPPPNFHNFPVLAQSTLYRHYSYSPNTVSVRLSVLSVVNYVTTDKFTLNGT
jgi:hypothetical protein